MVATRSGVRVCSPDRAAGQEASADMEATPTPRRTRRTAAQGSAQLHSDVTNACPGDKEDSSASREVQCSTTKRKTRSSKNQRQSMAQLDTTHEADVSESESCSSVAPESQSCPQTRSGRRRTSPRRKAPPRKELDEVSETESCCSSASATWGQSAQRNTRSKKKKLLSDGTPEQKGEVSERSEAESCSSVLPRASRTRTRAMLKTHEEDAGHSEPDSCCSSISGLRNTTVRRVTRASSRRAVSPIPMDLEKEADSDTSRSRQTRGSGVKLASASEPYDSEGFESGPSNTPRRSTRIRGSAKTVGNAAILSESESGLTDVYSPLESPSSVQAKSTPRSRRTASGKSSEGLAVPQVSVQVTVSNAVEVMEKEGVPGEDVILDSEDLLAEELAQDKTLTAEGEEMENMVELQVAAPNHCVNVTVPESVSTNKDDSDEKQGSTMDTFIVPESSQIQMSQKREDDTSVNEETVLDEQGSATETEPNCSVKVFLSECAPMEEDTAEVENLSDQEAQQTQKDYIDRSVAEEAVDGDAGVLVEQEADQPDMLRQKPDMLLLESSEEEDENDDESADEQESEGSNCGDKTVVLDESQAGPSKPGFKEPMDTDGLFVVDTRPGLHPDEKYYMDEEQEQVESSEEDKSEEEFIDEEDDDDEEEEDAKLLLKTKKSTTALSSTIDPGIKVKEMGGLYITFDGSKAKAATSSLKNVKEPKNVDELLKKSIIGPDFEKKDAVPPYKESTKKLKLKRREEREKTTGDGWFNMKAPEMTQELQNDLRALKMRSAMDPKRFYKKNDQEGFPKYLQMGTVVECPLDFYHSRIPKKQRKRTIVEELLADAEFRNYNKKKFREIMIEKAALATGRKNRKKNKFNKKGK
ncbi:deoxynucleotidyltransferase terminal-interacting protein 2 isoform X1 [Arapaima gigas]